jgi:hypothetical protein
MYCTYTTTGDYKCNPNSNQTIENFDSTKNNDYKFTYTQNSSYIPNMNYKINNSDSSILYSDSPSTCQKECNKDLECTGFAYPAISPSITQSPDKDFSSVIGHCYYTNQKNLEQGLKKSPVDPSQKDFVTYYKNEHITGIHISNKKDHKVDEKGHIILDPTKVINLNNTTNQKSFDACYTQCTRTKDCSNITYDYNSGDCILYKSK